MKYILLLRHAKSSHDEPRLKDFDRPLTPRGKKDATRVGHFIREIELLPGQIISSTAKRAKSTTELFSKAADIDPEAVTWNEDLYYGSAEDYIRAIQRGQNDVGTRLLVGHNPKIEAAVHWLCGDANVIIPTAALVCLQHGTRKWEHVQKGTASLKWMVIPELLKKIGR